MRICSLCIGISLTRILMRICPAKLKSLQTLKSLATTIDFLLKRWSFAYRGYDGNAHQAREDAKRASLADSETEDNFHGGHDPEELELKIILRALPDLEESAQEISDGPELLTPTPEPNGEPLVKKAKKERIATGVFNVLAAGEQKTSAIADVIGRSDRSVRRVLGKMMADGKVSLVKKGVYRLSRSVKWTETDNEILINEVLVVYTALIDACKVDVKEIFASQEISDTEKIRCVKTFNACVATIDRLMKRWSLVHLGWHTNTRLAKVDAEAKTVHAEKVNLEGAPLAAFFTVAAHYHRDMREIWENLPSPIKPANDETGTWSYDATTHELFPPQGSKPIGETEARRRLMKRKSDTPASLILFG